MIHVPVSDLMPLLTGITSTWSFLAFNKPVKVSPILAINFSPINRRFSVVTCHVAGAVVDVDTLTLVITEETDKLEVNVP